MCCFQSCGIAYIVFDSVNICVQSRKSSRGRLEWSHPIALPSQRGKAQGRAFSPGQPWGELESVFSEGAEVESLLWSVLDAIHAPGAFSDRSDPRLKIGKGAQQTKVLCLSSEVIFLWIWLVSF